MYIQRWVILLLLTAILPSCGKKERKNDKPSLENCLSKDMLFNGRECIEGRGLRGGQDRFLILGDAPFIDDLSKRTIQVCHLHESLSEEVVQRQQNDTRRALFAWLTHLQDLAPSLPAELVFHSSAITADDSTNVNVSERCSAYDDLIIVSLQTLKRGEEGEDREHAWVMGKQIWLNQGSSYNTILHELGHILGLGDTYVEVRWDCKKDFPNSIMCEPEWGQPLAADVAALRRNYCLMTDGNSELCFNHKKESILSFLTTKENGYRRPYLNCSTGDDHLNLQPFSLTVGAGDNDSGGYYGFYSTDDHSVEESFSQEEYRLTMNLEDNTGEPAARTLLSSSLMIARERIVIEGAGLKSRLAFGLDQCDFDPKFIEFIAVKTSIDLKSRREVIEPPAQPIQASLTFKKSDPATHTVSLARNLDLPLDWVTIHKKTDDGNQEYFASLPFAQIGTFEHMESGTVLTLHFQAVNLSPGSYVLVFYNGAGTHLELNLEFQE